jgi:hypothetical protein
MNGIMPVRELQGLDKKGESTGRDSLKQDLGDWATANPDHPDAKVVEFEVIDPVEEFNAVA